MPFFIPHPKYDIQNVLEQQQPEIFISYNFIVNSFKASPPGCATGPARSPTSLATAHAQAQQTHARIVYIQT